MYVYILVKLTILKKKQFKQSHNTQQGCSVPYDATLYIHVSFQIYH